MDQESATSQAWGKWLAGAAIGAAAMYLSDPDRGRRRRALIRDKMVSTAHRSQGALGTASRDLANRMQGVRAKTGRLFSRRPKGAGDQLLVERVRSMVGRAVSHPHAIKVHAQDGSVILSGPVLTHEKAQLLEAVRTVSGVKSIDDALQVHERAEGVPSLQGEGRPRQLHTPILQANWPPAWRAIATVGGGALGAYGMRQRSALGLAAAALGIGLFARGMVKGRQVSNRQGAQTVELHKSIYIDASPEAVFDAWSDYENFPQFMSNVREVRDIGEGRTHWKVSGPAGVQIEWDAMVTESDRPRTLAWRTTQDAEVGHTGRVRFEPAGDGTRVSVHMTYRPPAGMVGDAVATLFNGNPKHQLEEDLLRMKTHIEGNAPPRGVDIAAEQAIYPS
ncbi:SRPBCC family protein [Noviherbaspirillum sp. ST9]|uniref:SRPBCC family protein n=1 Tax=Noviherbaspirillum sp. ST9 TaxID=3401606 RepID=UPI003B587306